jgi:hypothetical protein
LTLPQAGLPLTSHDVVVNTIAATRTRTGLRVEAELDPSAYPLGVSVSAERMRTLPITSHARRGMWNYMIRPPGPDSQHDAGSGGPHRIGSQALHALSDPRLTGMSRDALDQLAAALRSAQSARAEQRFLEQRGGPGRQARGSHGRPQLTDAERVLAVILGLRNVCSWEATAELFQASRHTIGNATAWVRPLLEQDGCTITRSPTRYRTATALLSAIAGQIDSPDTPGPAS